MKTRKRTISVLLALALTACDSSNTLTEQPDDLLTESVPLTFAAIADEQQQPGTRADGITTANISSMGVFACYSGQGDWNDDWKSGSSLNYMFNQSMTRANSTAPWNYTPMKYWPNTAGDKISFFAYAPHNSQIPAGTLNIPRDTNKGALEFIHLPPDAAEDQIDLLIASPVLHRTKSGSPITFSFKHITAQIIFHVKSSDQILVQTISMAGVTSAAGWTIDKNGLACFSREVAIGSHHTATIGQNVPAGIPTKVATFFAAPCTILNVDASYDSPTVTMTYSQSGNTETLEAPLPIRWKEGDVIIFTLVLDKTKLDVTVTQGGNGMTWGGNGTEEEINDSNPIT